MGALGSESEFKPSCFVHSMYSEANQFKGQSSKANYQCNVSSFDICFPVEFNVVVLWRGGRRVDPPFSKLVEIFGRLTSQY